MPTNNISEFQKNIYDYYQKHSRNLPWRETTNPYYIVVSEIMLQQTQVPRVIDKYRSFIETFPTWESLAKASFSEVLEKWSGLGYNRRAKYLHTIAQKIVSEFKGILPPDPTILESFPGIGKATASSIVVYAFNKPIPFIETNVRRIYIHHFFGDKENIHDNEIMPLVSETLDHKNPREWYWALMDYGTYLTKVVENPNRKSKHYAKQSKFEGSIRQLRGEILRVLLNKKTITNQELQLFRFDQNKLQRALQSLVNENIIVKKRGLYKIR